jgi:uncharacterized protein with beta-barrel porin domain
MKEILIQIPASADAKSVFMPTVDPVCLLGGKVVTNGATIDAENVISFKVGSTTIGTATVANTSAAGTVDAIVMDATLATRKTQITAAAPLEIASAGSHGSATGFDVLLRLDEFALPRD